MTARALRTAAGLLLATGCVVVLGAAPASAHVFFDADKRVPGAADVTVALLVQGETQPGRAPAATTKVVMHLPTTNPLTGVTPKPTVGWQVAQTATTVTWTGGSIPAGGSEQFELTVAQLPRATSVDATVDQFYADGTEVVWGDPPRDPGPTPVPGATQALTAGIAHPQAQLVLDGVTAGGGSHVTQTTLAVPSVQSLSPKRSSSGTAVGVVVVVVVVAGVGGVLLARRRPVV